MKKYFLFFIIIPPSLFITTVVFAAGGGGGGSVPTCTSNVWTCTDWSSCSTSGSQTRSCTLTYSCPSASNQKPIETQSCAPPLPPPPSPTPSTNQSKLSNTTTNIPSQPSCKKSTWKCNAWSSSCNINGQEQRTCHLVADCPQSPTPSPATSQACTHLQCGDKPNLHDRITCRLGLAPAGVARELQIQYLPEECRAMTDKTEQNECIKRYKQYRPCWNLPVGDGRFICAREALNLGLSVSDQVHACQQSSNIKTCMDTLKEKVLYMIKFRFYDLEQRAEDLYYKGADPTAIANFDTTVETKKQEFNTAKTNDELRQIILDVRSAWQDFINKVKIEVK